VKAVIIAGGKGTRLRPYTTAFPKPLMPIGDKPVLEIIVRQLKAQGFNEIVMLVGYLCELIMAYFGDGSKFNVNITYCREERSLGTVGGLSLIKRELDGAFLTINGDTLTNLNFLDLVRSHNSNHAIATIALKERQLPVNFGVVEMDGGNEIKGYTEKPNIVNLVSMGVNAFSSQVMQYIGLNGYLDFPNLIQNLIVDGQVVKGYVFDGYWLDIGSRDDYERANTEIEKINGILGIS
jgi:NDP-sugar pyrophosphorylase family protein